MLHYALCLVLLVTGTSGTVQEFDIDIKNLQTECPTTPEQIASLEGQLLQQFGPLIAQLDNPPPTQSPIATQNTPAPQTTASEGRATTQENVGGATTEKNEGEVTTEETTEATTTPETVVETTTGQPTPAGPQTYTCSGTTGWRRVAFIDMTNTSHSCPPGFRVISFPRSCGRANDDLVHSTTFTVEGGAYNQVCGRMRGYQVGLANSFANVMNYGATLEDNYLDGISLTYRNSGSSSRSHIWSFAIGATEVDDGTLRTQALCPCDTSDSSIVSPGFVGNDYFCESGVGVSWPGQSAYTVIFPNDVLWDGLDCNLSSSCCQFQGPPWFTKTLPQSTTSDIELRTSFTFIRNTNDVAIELIELYVK